MLGVNHMVNCKTIFCRSELFNCLIKIQEVEMVVDSVI